MAMDKRRTAIVRDLAVVRGVLAIVVVVEAGTVAERAMREGRMKGIGDTFLCHDGLDSSTYSK